MYQHLQYILRTLVGKLLTVAFCLCILITLWVLLQVFCFTSFKIPSDSMAPALITGDNIIVNKLTGGARLFNLPAAFRKENIQIRRMPGIGTLKRNDILVFNFPYPQRQDSIGFDIMLYYVKRCVALPGDSFYIENGIYKAKNVSDTLGCYPHQLQISEKEGTDFGADVWNCFPYDTVHYKWNMKNFGPIYVPAAGDAVAIDTVNYLLYKNLIEYETKKKMKMSENKIFLGNKALDIYVFKQNYYFMAGDLVRDSRDSRYWGLLPEEFIAGRASFIWKSIDPYTGKMRWNRFLKLIR